MNVLVINAGSSSVKYQLFDMTSKTIIAKGLCERIGIDGHLKHTPVLTGKPAFDSDIPLPTHAEAINAVIEKLVCPDYGVIKDLSEINAIGHRVVHGGSTFSESVIIDRDVMAGIEKCVALAPLHNPANLMGINACLDAMPDVPNVAVFDTAFHHTIPEYAYVYPIPYKYYEENNIRRYGFHGTSHRFISAKAIEYLGINTEGSKLITCHLGNGSSLAAIKDGKSIDTTMGVTPLEGVPMGTRCGSIDPSIIEILSNIEGNSDIADVMNILNKKSGVLGVSGISSDFRDLETAAGVDSRSGDATEGVEVDPRAKLALEIFSYQVAKYIGSYSAVMGGVDAIIFTAGVGENSPYTRARTCDFLKGLDICIDENVNKAKAGGNIMDITGKGSKAKVLVIPTDEELVIASDTMALVRP